ncbi:PREDICTED: uncharacterized protein LOC108571236 [Habropoda laboriosa]|uniref:uncharacterized protein LOC108571236 n=1 Tax=Habropoda laboriosa TaxID=597456 RepID=UPI00083E5856|nr:PREDICTED: uncharacterized protein LOC108571236 [Habropoda laboriosa]
MKAHDEAPSNLESTSAHKADKNEDDVVDDDTNDKPTTDTDTVDTKVVQETSEPSLELPPTLHERFMRIKQLVKDAVANHRTFMIYGRTRVIRESMLKRGWCEKFFRKTSTADQHFTVEASPVVLLGGIGDLKDQQSERQLISRMLTNHTVDFLWNTGSEWPGWPSQDNKGTIFNRYCRAGFTSKVGLCSNVRQMHWYYEAGVANTLFPRCYNLCQGDQMHAFIEDFRFTACLGLLKWLVTKITTEGENAVRSPTGTVPVKALEFAIKRCSDYISAQSHEDIDQEAERVWAHQWDQFIGWYYQIVHGQALFIRNNVPFQKFFLAAKHISKKMKKYWPQIDMDGVMNVWIMKPGNKSRGRGIVLLNKLEDVMAKMNPSNKSDTRYVVQKYIERPLLVYSTKFDIRQWFIITCAQPLTLWIYKESYLRFCSQKFSLTDFHESIHLCNHAIQCKYTNCGDRDPALPSDNMWDATTFKEFLKSQGNEKAWDDIVYPGMKQGLVGSLLASQEAMDRRKNSFELYGADFMVMEDFSVWLIEINSHPDMSYSSRVTTRLCRQVLEDTVKVVIDYREDKNADTGHLQGTRIATCANKSNLNTQESKVSLVSKSPMTCLTKKKSTVHNQIGPVIVDLIEELEIQLDQEFYAYYKVDSPKLRQVLPASAPPKPLKTSVLIDKQESTVKSAPVGGTAGNLKPKPTTLEKGNQRNASRSPRKPNTFTGTANNKADSSPVRQSLVSKIMAFQKQSSKLAPKTEKSFRQTDEKIIKTAVRDAIKKYKKSAALSNTPPETPTLPSLLTATNKVGQTATGQNKNRNVPKKYLRPKRNKVLSDITDMYAVGLSVVRFLGGLEPIEKLLRSPANLIWYTNKKVSSRTEERTIVNKFAGCYFTSKPAQTEEFVRDFYITACMGMLKWFLLLASIAGPNAVWSSEGTVPIKAILFALERCAEHISISAHEDVDGQDYKHVSSSEWIQFLSWHDQLLRKREILEKKNEIDVEELLKFTADTVKEMVDCCPQSEIDGMRNVWILKPGDKSLGRGIILKNSLRDILNKINQAAKECMQYVVQKYIERPLLVHATKVDVRQWFLITSTQPLTVWMYRDILLRFASKDFTLENFHESIHLCNTTVQLKYRKTLRQNAQIPGELHWNLQNFKEYLKATDRELAWEKLIKPGIKQNLIGALLASQENMVNRRNSFQLYGADFLIMEDLSVWLIEINTNPRLHPPSSSVTEKLYPEIIEDTMKVVLDRRKNRRAAHGKFECIFKQRNPFYGNVLGKAVSLGIRGKAIHSQQTSPRKLSPGMNN